MSTDKTRNWLEREAYGLARRLARLVGADAWRVRLGDNQAALAFGWKRPGEQVSVLVSLLDLAPSRIDNTRAELARRIREGMAERVTGRPAAPSVEQTGGVGGALP